MNLTQSDDLKAGDRVVHVITGERGVIRTVTGRRVLQANVRWRSGISGWGWLENLRLDTSTGKDSLC